MENNIELLQSENYLLKLLIKDIIETLEGRDDSVKEWIQERIKEIEER